MFCCDSRKGKKPPLPRSQGTVMPQSMASSKETTPQYQNPNQKDDLRKKKSETDSLQQSTQQGVDSSVSSKQIKSFSQSRVAEDDHEEIQRLAIQIKSVRAKLTNQIDFRKSVEEESMIIQKLIKEQLPDEFYLDNCWAIEYTQYLSKPQKWMRSIDNTELLENQRNITKNSIILINKHNRSTILKKHIQEGKDYATLNRKAWYFLVNLYGGGPEIRVELHSQNILPPNLAQVDENQKEEQTPLKPENNVPSLNQVQTSGRFVGRNHSSRQNDGTVSEIKSNEKQQKLQEYYQEIKQQQSLIKQPNENLTQQTIEENQLLIEMYNNLGSMEIHEIPLVGLRNSRFYCYMNSALQCLMGISQVNSFFLSEKPRRIKGQKRLRFVPAYTEFLTMVDQTRGRNIPVVSAQILQVLSASKFSQFEQQDSHEFLLYFLSELQEEMVGKYKRPEFQSSSEAWRHYCSTHDDIIDQVFAGQITSTVQCKHCKTNSEAYDPILDLSLPIPKKILSGDFNLNESLKQYFQEEEINDTWKCEKCHKKSSKVKRQIQITKTPNILIIELKRFSVFPKRSKIQNGVQYPDSFDLANFCSKAVLDTKYRLKSLIIHEGSINGGHYMAIGKKKNNWYLFDDENVDRIADFESLKQKNAYVLFYEKMQ